jgi:Na+/H+ antiporter NhaB
MDAMNAHDFVEWLTVAVAIVVPMIIGFFALYSKLNTLQSDIRLLTNQDGEHGRRIDDHELRLRILEGRRLSGEREQNKDK